VLANAGLTWGCAAAEPSAAIARLGSPTLAALGRATAASSLAALGRAALACAFAEGLARPVSMGAVVCVLTAAGSAAVSGEPRWPVA
jgi:hypothetical protein